MGQIFLGVLGGSFGFLAAAGVFTVLVAVGLIPRFAGRTHTGKKFMLYEECVIWGTIVGTLLSVFQKFFSFGERILLGGIIPDHWWKIIGNILLGCTGIFAGMFVGCLALAIAEMLDSIPIFARRVQFRHGIGIGVLSMAAGKIVGSLLYFYMGIYQSGS